MIFDLFCAPAPPRKPQGNQHTLRTLYLLLKHASRQRTAELFDRLHFIWGVHMIFDLFCAAAKAHQDEKEKLAAERVENYREFMKRAVSHKNGQMMHRILKKKPSSMTRPVAKDKMDTTENHHHADHQITDWAKVWGSKIDDDPQSNTLEWTRTKVSPSRKDASFHPPAVSANEVARFKAIIRSFNRNTAMAHDRIPPRIIDDVGDSTLSFLIQLFKRCEECGDWPVQWKDAITVMIPKAEQFKWRLIALLVTPHRIWARVASERASAWMKSLSRDWIANGPKKSNEDVAYEIALDAECAAGNFGEISVVMMDDLEKGFEKVDHVDLFHKADIYHYPSQICNAAVSMYQSPRRVKCASAYSKPTSTRRGVLVGCPIAMSLLLLANLSPVDDLWQNLPSRIKMNVSSFKVYVDDFIIAFRFDTNKLSRDEVQAIVTGAYIRLSQAITASGANFAVGKGRVVATEHDIATRIANALNWCQCGDPSKADPSKCDPSKRTCDTNHKIEAKDKITILGVDYAAGRPIGYHKNRERVVESKTKAVKIVSLCKGGPFALNLIRAHVHSSAFHGTRVNGMNDKVLDDVRAMTRAATTTRAAGGSTRLDLLLQSQRDIDPSFDANCAPLLEWAKRVNMAYYNKDLSCIEIMRSARASAIANMLGDNSDEHRVWTIVRGPASACIATLGRIGWDIGITNSWRIWIDRNGDDVDLAAIHHHSLKKKALTRHTHCSLDPIFCQWRLAR